MNKKCYHPGCNTDKCDGVNDVCGALACVCLKCNKWSGYE